MQYKLEMRDCLSFEKTIMEPSSVHTVTREASRVFVDSNSIDFIDPLIILFVYPIEKRFRNFDVTCELF